MFYNILGDTGAVSGGGEKPQRARKNFGRRKVKNERKSPWGQGFNGPAPNGQSSSGFLLVPENLCFSLQLQSSKTRNRFVFSYTENTCRSVAGHICLGRSNYSAIEGLLEEKSSSHSRKYRKDRSAYPQETRLRYAGPFAGIVASAHLKDCEFLYTH